MQRYDSYKPSGVKWLGEIPSHWEVIPMKYCMQIKNGMDYKQVVADYGYPVIGSGGQFAYASDYMHDGEVVFFGRKGTIDKPLHFKGKFWAVDTMFYAIPKKIYGKFLYYVGLTIPYKYYSTATALPSMTQTDLGNNPICFPPLEEQAAIANYLDTATAKIDAAIAQQQKMIDLLNERKQIIINRAVTRGLNPNARMKDSGVEWIGEVPEHWEVRRLKTLFNYISRGITPNYVEQSNCRVVNQATFSKGFFDRDNQRFTVAMEYNDSFVRNGDILMASTGGGVLGKVYYFEGQEDNNVADSHVTIIRTDNKEVNGKFYCYLFSTQYDMINAVMAKGSTNQTELQRQELTSLFVPVPTRKEQDEIVKHLDTLSEQIETIIVQYRNQISLLQERKQIIINEVVTGKVKVM